MITFNKFLEEKQNSISVGREKKKVSDLVGEALNLTGFSFVEDYCVLIFKEYPNNYFFGNSFMRETLNCFVEVVGGVELANQALQQEPGRVTIESRTSKKTNRIYYNMIAR